MRKFLIIILSQLIFLVATATHCSFAQEVILFNFDGSLQGWLVKTYGAATTGSLDLCGKGTLSLYDVTIPSGTAHRVDLQSKGYDPSLLNTGLYSYLGDYSMATQFFADVYVYNINPQEDLMASLFIRTGNETYNVGSQPYGWDYYESTWTPLEAGKWMRLVLNVSEAFGPLGVGKVQNLNLLQAIGVGFKTTNGYTMTDYRKIKIDNVGVVLTPEPSTLLLLLLGVLVIGIRKATRFFGM